MELIQITISLKHQQLKEVFKYNLFILEKGEGQVDPTVEPRTMATGVNRSMYFVTSDLTKDWVELEDAKPIYINAARKINYTLTGKLEAKIITNPHFPGLERDYLRAQIARITHNMTIIPNNGQFKVNPDNKREYTTEEAKPLKIQDVLNINNWVHFLQGILKEGRTIHEEKAAPEGIEPDVFKKQIEDADKFDDLLSPITKDLPLTSSIPNIKIPAWKLQFMYDDKIYTNPNIKLNPDDEAAGNPPKDNSANYTMIFLKSFRWPGAMVFRYKNENYYFYFGWGKKFGDSGAGEKFVFKDFQPIQAEPDDYDYFPEPNSPPHEQEKQGDIGNMGDADA